MHPHLAASASTLAIALLPLAAGAQPDVEIVKVLLKDAESATVSELEPSPAAREKLMTALGADPAADTGKVVLGVASELPNPLEDPETLETAWGTVASAGRAKIALIAFRDSALQNRLTIVDLCILSPPEVPPPIRAFARDIRWKALGANAYEPLSRFRTLQAASSGGGDGARELKVLLSHVRHMQEIETHQDALKRDVETKDAAGARVHADALLSGLETAHKAYEQVDFLFAGGAEAVQKQRHILQQQSAKALEEARSLREAASSNNMSLVSRRLNALACSQCHGSFEKVFQDRRAALKIGNGYFVPGHDLPPAEEAHAPLAQDVAAAARKALLLIDLLGAP